MRHSPFISATTPKLPIPALDGLSSMKKIVSTISVGVMMLCFGGCTPSTWQASRRGQQPGFCASGWKLAAMQERSD
jgi:hypothetical protein